MNDATTSPAADLAFRARALAQAHPLSAAVQRIVNRAVAEERNTQAVAEAGVWAGSALTQGYCLRRVEEAHAGAGDVRVEPTCVDDGPVAVRAVDAGRVEASVVAARAVDAGTVSDLTDEALEAAAVDVADAVRAGRTSDLTRTALNLLVAAQVENRFEQWRDELDGAALGEIEQYITWWVVKGYSLRAAETAPAGANPCDS
ncbi:MAG: hypothetical protein ABIZ34_08955 [Candidatus Limnocylindrales bacterium]